METVHAIYEAGVFRPVLPVALPEHSEVEFEPRLIERSNQNGVPPTEVHFSQEGLKKVYAILSERYESGHTDTAARHNDHQP